MSDPNSFENAHLLDSASISVLRRLQQLVAEARRKDEIENKVWRGLVVLVCLVLLIVILGAGFFYFLTWRANARKEALRVAQNRFFISGPAAVPDKEASIRRSRDEAVAARDAEAVSSKRTLSVETEKWAAFRSYRRSVVSKIEAEAATDGFEEMKALGLNGSVYFRLDILPDGSSFMAALTQPSENEAINRAACRLLTKSAPFPAYPKELVGTGTMPMLRWMTFNLAEDKPNAVVGVRPPTARLLFCDAK